MNELGTAFGETNSKHYRNRRELEISSIKHHQPKCYSCGGKRRFFHQFRKPRKCSLACRREVDRSYLRRGENRITRIALAIALLFLCCHIWKVVPTVYEAIHATPYSTERWPNWLLHLNHWSHNFIVFNSAVNFLLYTIL